MKIKKKITVTVHAVRGPSVACSGYTSFLRHCPGVSSTHLLLDQPRPFRGVHAGYRNVADIREKREEIRVGFGLGRPSWRAREVLWYRGVLRSKTTVTN